MTLNYVPMSMFTTKTTIFFVNEVVGEFQHEIIASVEPPAITAEVRPSMTLSVDQIINWDYQLNPKNDMIARAKKAVENLKKNKKGQPQQNAKDPKTVVTEPPAQETFYVDIGANPYVTSKDNIIIVDKPPEKVKETKDAKDTKEASP